MVQEKRPRGAPREPLGAQRYCEVLPWPYVAFAACSYASKTFSAAERQDRFTARLRPFLRSLVASVSSPIVRRIASATAAESFATRSAASPHTSSANGVAKATTGVPAAIASSGGR